MKIPCGKPTGNALAIRFKASEVFLIYKTLKAFLLYLSMP